MAGHKPSNQTLQPVSGGSGPRGPMPMGFDTTVWLSGQAAPGSLMVRPGIQIGVSPGPEVWEVPLSPPPYTFRGRMVLYEPRVGAGEAGTWFQSPSEGTFHRPCNVLRCIPRLALPEDVSAVEKEMEQLAKELRQRRMSLGYSQADVGFAVGALFGKVLSQTTICRFEAQQLSLANMWKLQPLLKMWLEEVDAKNLLGLCRMEMILQQAQKWRRASRERRIGNNLEQFFLQYPKPTPQQMSRIAGQLRLRKDLVQVWFYNRSKRGNLPANYFSSPEVGVARPPFPGGTVCFPPASGLQFGPPNYGGPYFTPLYSSASFPEGGTLLSVPGTTRGLPRLSN
ncbi:POU domain, class 5, transcription factor 2 [Molossus molossus]|uniref:POU domain protein n=1 Tax=Molossus molossus TaxID=27622 RepID=A0A7J8J2V8_MOLMO|nr:POU domain, class 5, transcription factor 2 [Molossus molossus]KAF6490665.1 POU domain class 5, transcription factor 2 [Molossus molossus]